MFKDYWKYLFTTIKVYLFVLVIIIIMKIVGLDYFGLDVNNTFMVKLNDLITSHWYLKDIINLTTLSIQFYFYLCMVCNKKGLYKEAIISSFINICSQIILSSYFKFPLAYQFVCFFIIFVLPIMITKKVQIKRQIVCVLMIYLYQFISLFVRNIGVTNNYGNFIIDVLLNTDQLILLAITYKLYFMKGEFKLCLKQEVGSYSLKKMNLKKSLKRLQKNLHSFKAKPKVERISIIIYLILSLIWNVLTVILVLIISQLNHTFIECIFILTSFWLSKRAFGKPFHLSSMVQCFIVSNLTYYTLNRITTPLGISILVPILLGVGLSYITSKLVKKTYKPLYKGMPEDLFEETILKVTDKNSVKYKICYDFYILKESDVSLSFKYNYSIAGIRKVKDRINDKIKELK